MSERRRVARSARGRACGALTLALVLAAVPALALGNMAAPWKPGDPVSEPMGSLGSVAVTRETLAFDLSPLSAGGSGTVSATYEVRNTGGLADLALIFVSPGIRDGVVSVDGTPVSVQPVIDPVGPPQWSPPTAAPAIGGGELPYTVDSGALAGLRFDTSLTPGLHRFSVQYEVRPSEYHDANVYRSYEIGYVLAPARSWASFGQLDLSVSLPAGWEAASSLPMSRTGDRLQATFTGVPADTLAITARHALPGSDDSTIIWMPLLAGGLIGLVLGALAGWLLRRRKTGKAVWFSVGTGTVVLGALAGAVVAATADGAWLGTLDESQLSRTWMYGHGNAAAALVLMSLLSGTVLSLVGMLLMRRPNKPA